jgi:hypothetical protein
MAIPDNKGGFGGTNPNAETPSDNKVEKASGLAQVAKDILRKFMDSIGYRQLEARMIASNNKLQRGEGTQADKDEVLAAIDVAERKLKEGAFDDAPAGVPQNYFSKTRQAIEKLDVV